MRVLITNAHLENHAGTEVVVRDLALELVRQGHEPVVYSPKLGTIAAEISKAGIEVTADLRTVACPPDIIHGQHHSEVVEALLQFPATPAIYVCHNATAQREEPFYFPRILRYVAVDLRCKKRIESIAGISSRSIEVIENAVNLDRFQLRPPLPEKPKRALVFSNYEGQLPAIRRACRRKGLELAVVGRAARTALPNPESFLPQYDIVFAKARCALEAMTVGCAVVLCDFAGAGPMVTARTFEDLRRMNFGQGVLVNPLRPEFLTPEIAHYDPADAAEVCQRARKAADLKDAVHRWIALYADVAAEFRNSPRDYSAEYQALADYLRKWSYKGRVGWEGKQLEKLRGIPVFGNTAARTAIRMIKKWSRW